MVAELVERREEAAWPMRWGKTPAAGSWEPRGAGGNEVMREFVALGEGTYPRRENQSEPSVSHL